MTDSTQSNKKPSLSEILERARIRDQKQNEIRELVELIGGFKYWPLLNEDCQMEVIKYLDYKSRYRLGLCSKQNYATVEKTPIDVHSLEIVENERLPSEFRVNGDISVLIVIYFFGNDHSLELAFSPSGNDTKVSWIVSKNFRYPTGREVIWENCNYYETAVRFAENWLKKCNYNLISFNMEMKTYPMQKSRIKNLPNCKRFGVTCEDLDTIQWWLGKVPEKLNYFHLETSDSVLTKIWEIPKVTSATDGYTCETALTDTQFLKLQANSLHLNAKKITEVGINTFVKEWVSGLRNRFTDAKFEFSKIWGIGFPELIRNWNIDVLLNGLKAREWNNGLEKKARKFFSRFKETYGPGSFYQIKSFIDPFESLTMTVSTDCIWVLKTGRRVTKDGQVSTEYGN